MHVLVIDDDASIRKLYEIWLRQMPEDPTVAGAGTLEEAYWHLRHERPDVVLLDVGLPDGNGLDAVRELLARAPDLDIILVTADAAVETEQAAERLGVADFLVKSGASDRTLTRAVRWARQRRADRHRLVASERHHRQVVRHLPGTLITLYDSTLRCLLAEGAFIEEIGARSEEFVGRHVSEIGDPRDGVALIEPMERALQGEPSTLGYFARRHKRHMVVEVLPYRDHFDEITGVILVARDVTTTRRIEREQRRAETRFRTAFEGAPTGMAIIDLDGRLVQVNATLADLTGAAVGDDGFELVHPDERDEIQKRFAALTPQAPHLDLELRLVSRHGGVRWGRARVALLVDDDDQPLHALAQIEDVTERRLLEAELQYQADHDPLTGLRNRRAFERALEDHLVHVRRYGPAGALLLLDLDGLKRVNDVHGHQAGDRMLTACADALRERLRESDVVARIGGDEFAVLTPVGGRAQAEAVAAALVAQLRVDLGADGAVTASVGVAVIDHADWTRDRLMGAADAALYAVKRGGRDGYQLDGISDSVTNGA